MLGADRGQVLSYLQPMQLMTSGVRGIGGRLRSCPEDFEVEEVPAYEPTGTGDHLFLWLEKRDLSGERMLERLADLLEIPQEEIGSAGIKDKLALTRQMVSVPRACASRLQRIDSAQLKILSVTPNEHKLRTGHLEGNRFNILIRAPIEGAFSIAQAKVRLVKEKGLANAYGPQRFGREGETLRSGMALLRQTPEGKGRRLKPFMRRLVLSAVQSALFNQVLRDRLDANLLHTLLKGDVAYDVHSEGCFCVRDLERDRARFEAREIAPTGPMFGPKMVFPKGEILRREKAVLEAAKLDFDHFERFPKLTRGTRRPLLVWPAELSVQAEPEGIRFRFVLPPGSYATVLLRELMEP